MIIFGIIGIILLIFGLYIRGGGFKTWYLAKGTPVVAPRAIQNMMIPLGITFIIWGIIWSGLIADVKIGNRLFGFIVMPMFIISIILGIWNPRWLRPRWLVYLEDEYGIAMWHLLEERVKDPQEWEQQVRTQAGLEKWAEETRQALGYPPHPGQIERAAKARQGRNRK